MSMPRYVRFARAIALVGVVTSPGCYQAHERPTDAGPVDAFVPDAPDAGPCARPLPCTCPTLINDGTCTGDHLMCCPVVGPLSPPDLAA